MSRSEISVFYIRSAKVLFMESPIKSLYRRFFLQVFIFVGTASSDNTRLNCQYINRNS